MNEGQKELLRQRVDAAARALNEALEDAYRFGLRGRISVPGGEDHQTVAVTLMRPVDMSLTK